ncbi:MAG TPA: AgmX/PglI C-terminal domain-containing protein, partial [Polyangia bacterium]
DYARWGIAAPERAEDAHLGQRHSGQQPTSKRFGIRAPSSIDRGAPSTLIFGRGMAAGSDAVNVLGGLVGNQIAESYGTGVLGIIGTGSGGGGTGVSTIGAGNFGTLGKGGGGYGRGLGGPGGRRASAPEVIPGPSTVRGSLDKEIIRRIIRMHSNEVKFCYEQELARHPALSGRISVQFVIAANGEVTSSVLQSSTVNNPRVESCVVQAFRRWEFPKASGATNTIVSYPFNFVPGGWDRVAHVAMPSVVPQAPVSDAPWDVSLAALRGKGELAERVAKVAAMLVAPATESPSVLAWWIVERHLRSGPPIPGACILAANLLREANQPHEAGRILSEAGGVDLVATTAEFRRWSSGPDVTRLTALAARK